MVSGGTPAGSPVLKTSAPPPASSSPAASSWGGPPQPALQGFENIQHLIFIVQENRSFDQYFGTFPGADGIPTNAKGDFTVCAPDPVTGVCARPYHDGTLVDQ